MMMLISYQLFQGFIFITHLFLFHSKPDIQNHDNTGFSYTRSVLIINSVEDNRHCVDLTKP